MWSVAAAERQAPARAWLSIWIQLGIWTVFHKYGYFLATQYPSVPTISQPRPMLPEKISGNREKSWFSSRGPDFCCSCIHGRKKKKKRMITIHLISGCSARHYPRNLPCWIRTDQPQHHYTQVDPPLSPSKTGSPSIKMSTPTVKFGSGPGTVQSGYYR